jgi:hypothetical protein
MMVGPVGFQLREGRREKTGGLGWIEETDQKRREGK